MAKARITFTDGVGAATLSSEFPIDVACRFRGFKPDTSPQGDTAVALADESLHMFKTSTRYGCHFEIHGIFMGTNATTSMLNIANRLKAHLEEGGACAVATEDANGASYASVGLMPGTRPEIVQTNARALEYAMRLSLINRSAAAMVCNYQ